MKDDVAIVGAGPAGSWAAYRLAGSGARVTLYDPSHPREKPCGGGVTGRALTLVGDALDLTSCPRTAIRSARFTTALQVVGSNRARPADRNPDRIPINDRSAVVSLDASALVVSSRVSFDATLLAAAIDAGARVEAARVTNLAVDGGSVCLETSAGARRASRVIGADGANSLVRRRLAQPFRRDQLSIATGFFAHGVTSDEIVVELVGDPPGYIWSFPRPGHLAIGICAQADAGVRADALRATTAAWIESTGIASGARLTPYSWPIPSLAARDFDTLALAGPRWSLVGDAAGLVDPITREGIFFALASGGWAADALIAPAAPSRYSSRVRDEAVPELARAARLKAAFFRPSSSGLMMGALRQSEAIRAVMADLIAGRQSYTTLKWRLLKTFEIGLACRALISASSSRRAL